MKAPLHIIKHCTKALLNIKILLNYQYLIPECFVMYRQFFKGKIEIENRFSKVKMFIASFFSGPSECEKKVLIRGIRFFGVFEDTTIFY